MVMSQMPMAWCTHPCTLTKEFMKKTSLQPDNQMRCVESQSSPPCRTWSIGFRFWARKSRLCNIYHCPWSTLTSVLFLSLLRWSKFLPTLVFQLHQRCSKSCGRKQPEEIQRKRLTNAVLVSKYSRTPIVTPVRAGSAGIALAISLSFPQ